MTLFDYWEEATSNHRVGRPQQQQNASGPKSATQSTASRGILKNRNHPWPQPTTKASSSSSSKSSSFGKHTEYGQENDENENVQPAANKSGKTMVKNVETTATKSLGGEKSHVGRHTTDRRPLGSVPQGLSTLKSSSSNKTTNVVKSSDAAVVPLNNRTTTSASIIPTATTFVSTTTTTPIMDQPAVYLVYEPDSSGRLVEHYVREGCLPTSHSNAIIGRWTAGSTKSIATFKLKRNAGRNVLQSSCAAGVIGRKNYCSGWCQFVKSAFIQESEDVTLWDPTGKGMNVDVYLYYDDDDHTAANSDGSDGTRPRPQTVRLIPGVPTSTRRLRAVAAIPKNTPFYERHVRIGLHKWLQDGNTYGYSTKI